MSRSIHALVAILTVAALMGGVAGACACAIPAPAGAHDCCADEGDVVLAAAAGCCGGEAPTAAQAVSTAVGAPSPAPVPQNSGVIESRPALVPFVPLRSPWPVLRI